MTTPGPGLTRALVALCLTEIVSWGTLYYSLPVAVSQIAGDTGWSDELITGIFSASLAISAIMAIPVGRLIDRIGPRIVMTAGAAVSSAALAAVGLSRTLPEFILAWLIAGAAQAGVLYPPAFTAITRWYGAKRTWPLTIVTLTGGLASTVFAPLTAHLAASLGWHKTYFVLAALTAVITIPLHAVFLSPPWPGLRKSKSEHSRTATSIRRSAKFRCLQVSLTAIMLALFAVTINMVPLMMARGLSYQTAATTLGLVGAGQLAGRFLFTVLPRHAAPSSQLTVLTVTGAVALGLIAVIPGPAAILIASAIFAGAIRGSATLVQANAVSERWGTEQYGTLNGLLSAPVTFAMAAAPFLGSFVFGLTGSTAMTAAIFALVGLVGVVFATKS
ncbi:MFS transporter [Spelaeicoccus albus]|uniref:MFS family permease n=1 Tax=Spelaeicoccus albus TaxID=1280376 RepID=A0A7Z0IH94_9MICO|nr:MFS family permease [Spelaeicoccus albus]